VARRKAAQPGGDHMVSQFNIFCVEADEFTWKESSTSLEVAKDELNFRVQYARPSVLS
jgi:hypothetical protein